MTKQQPDFDQIARRLIEPFIHPAWTEPIDRPSIVHRGERYIKAVAEQLRQVWNARGAADIDVVGTAIDAARCSPPTLADIVIDLSLERAIHMLDRF